MLVPNTSDQEQIEVMVFNQQTHYWKSCQSNRIEENFPFETRGFNIYVDVDFSEHKEIIKLHGRHAVIK